MKTVHYLFVLPLVALCIPACAPRRVIHVYNGRSLDGFYTFLRDRGRDNHPKQVFTIVDGAIRVSGEEFGCLTSNDEFSDYRIICEYKWGEKTFPPRVGNARDSGLLLHSVGPDGAYGGMWMYSIEVQIIEGGAGDLIVVGDGSEQYSLTATSRPPLPNTSRDWDPQGQPATIYIGRINRLGRSPDWQDVADFQDRTFEHPRGEWNRLDCTAYGDEITVKLNDRLVNRAIQVKPSRGRIQLQSECAEIYVRRIDLIPLNREKR